MKFNKKRNPFSLSFGKEPISCIDRSMQKVEIIDAFEDDNPSHQVCMITGVRGSGKTVLLTEIGKHFRDKKEWVVIDLTPERDLLTSFAAELYNQKELRRLFRVSKINLSFLGLGVQIEGVEPITDINVAIRYMLECVSQHGKKVLITIDEATCNRTMKEFVSVFQIYIRQELSVFLLLSGLYDKIYELQNEETLTFLYRAPRVELTPLHIGSIAKFYQGVFGLNDDDSLEMARATKGYSFAFQVLGYLCYQKSEHWTNVLDEYSHYLDDFVYDKIWSELSAKDKQVVYAMASVADARVVAIRKKMKMSASLFSGYRDRLLKKGIVTSPDYGRLEFTLPRFREFALGQIV